MPPKIVPVTAFVDWNSQIHIANPPRSSPRDVAERTLDCIGRRIGNVLGCVDADRRDRFDVFLRIYHGWHKGFEQTDNRRALAMAIAGADFAHLSTKSNVQIRPNIGYGDRLLSAEDKRLHNRLGIHLPDTLRQVNRKGRKPVDYEEKMIDTAIASDVVHLAHSDPDRWLVVIGEDDDLVPPVYTAEAIRGDAGGRVFLVRTRKSGSFLKLDGIQVNK